MKLGKQNLNGKTSIQSSFDLFYWKNLPIFSDKKGWCFGAFVAWFEVSINMLRGIIHLYFVFSVITLTLGSIANSIWWNRAKLVWCNLLNAHMLPPTGKLALAGSECFFEPSRSNFCIFPPGFCLILGLCWATTIFFCSNLEWKMGRLVAWIMNDDVRPWHMEQGTMSSARDF